MELEAAVTAPRRFTALVSREEAQHVSRILGTTGTESKRCDPVRILTVAGVVFMDDEGKANFLLSDFHCSVLQIIDPVVFVATPNTFNRVFLTVVPIPVDDGNDLRIRMAAFDSTGQPVPKIEVSWICRIPIFSGVD